MIKIWTEKAYLKKNPHQHEVFTNYFVYLHEIMLHTSVLFVKKAMKFSEHMKFIIITSVKLHFFVTVIVYTRSMFISLWLRSQLISAFLFQKLFIFKLAKNRSFLH